MEPSNRWIRVLVEGLVIVASILAAFAIDAAWAERRERLEEAEVLAGLRREFEGYQDAIEYGLASQAQMMDAMADILASIEAGAWTSERWTVDEAIGQSLRPPTSDLGNGVRDALVQGGRLELITDRTLRERLAAWPGYFEELLDDETFGRDMVFDQIIPHLTSRGYPLASVMGALATEIDWPVERGAIHHDPATVGRLLGDPEYRALVEVRFGFWAHAEEEYRAALSAADSILRDLERLGAGR